LITIFTWIIWEKNMAVKRKGIIIFTISRPPMRNGLKTATKHLENANR
jgi:hypothetical protein